MTRKQASIPTNRPKAVEGIKVPSVPTLRKYGLSFLEWCHMVQLQSGRCYICERYPNSARLCIDHLHIKGWKKMPPDKRKQYVRGLLCTYCNYRLMHKGMTLERARKVVSYLEHFEKTFEYRALRSSEDSN